MAILLPLKKNYIIKERINYGVTRFMVRGNRQASLIL